MGENESRGELGMGGWGRGGQEREYPGIAGAELGEHRETSCAESGATGSWWRVEA